MLPWPPVGCMAEDGGGFTDVHRDWSQPKLRSHYSRMEHTALHRGTFCKSPRARAVHGACICSQAKDPEMDADAQTVQHSLGTAASQALYFQDDALLATA